MDYHVPVLLDQCIEGLNLIPDGVYVDVTFGGGGHSREIYKQLTSGKLIAFDQDPDAAENAKSFLSNAKRSFVFVQANFRHLARYLRFHGVDQVDGILADLGVSSHQFDVGERGFSTRFDGDLNMRMDQGSSKTASEIINTYPESDLVHMFSYLGDIKNARSLARVIVQHRSQQLIQSTGQLRSIAESVAPKGKQAKYLAQLFQAIRIEVNEEMEALGEFLLQCGEVIKPGGRLVVMSYHSLEDRPVKNYLTTGNLKGKQEKDFYGNLERPFDPNPKKPVTPSAEEIERNNRARSAKLRIGIKR